MQPKLARLTEIVEKNAPLLVAYSGGVDSAYLLAAATQILAPTAVLGVIADSPSLPRRALTDALALAQAIGARVEVVRTEEMADPNYVANPLNRCYFCKAELFTRLDTLARERGFAAIAYGENADDMRQVRPGRQAAAEFRVLAPLRDADLTKQEIRALSRELGLPTADAPAQPCLSSRVPHGSPVTLEALALIERGEEFVRSLGFRVFRVRHYTEPVADGVTPTPRARVQIAPEEMSARLPGLVSTLERGLRDLGYATVEIDPAGYRSTA
ncbi:MAG: ATP-dependent sacrificial sulfur transferase LarE [Verrucomicrobia bacterium]|nr:ATP-dependent sacrificial sulfur transferase LarE [Verrucomicrobiota bacterium]